MKHFTKTHRKEIIFYLVNTVLGFHLGMFIVEANLLKSPFYAVLALIVVIIICFNGYDYIND